MTGFKSIHPCALDESSLSIGRDNEGKIQYNLDLFYLKDNLVLALSKLSLTYALL